MGLISRVSSRTYRFKTCARLPTVKRQTRLATSLKFSTQPTKMKYVAAYMLAALSGDAPNKAAVKKVLESVGAEINDEQLDKVFSELDGKDVNAVVAEGMSLLAPFHLEVPHQLPLLPVVMLLQLPLRKRKRRKSLKKNPTLTWALTCLDNHI